MTILNFKLRGEWRGVNIIYVSTLNFMFLKELVEDFTYDDIEFVFLNDKYFLFSTERYKLTEEDEINFSLLKNSKEVFKKYSLEVVSLTKNGLLSRVEIVDQEDDTRNIREVSLEELASYPVDMVCSSNNRKSIQLIISILLEKTFYIHLETSKSSKDVKNMGSVENEVAVIED